METKLHSKQSEDVGQKRQQNNRASVNNVACNGKLRQRRTDREGAQCLNKIMRCGVVIRKKQKFWKFMNDWEKGQESWNDENFNTFPPVAAPEPVQREHQRQTPWQDPGENRQRDWSATCSGWCCKITQKRRIPGN